MIGNFTQLAHQGIANPFHPMANGGKDSAPAPDYTPVANASKESAQIAADLGREQLAENKRQYGLNMAVSQPIITKQGLLMDEQLSQGKEYANRAKTTWDEEDSLIADAQKSDADSKWLLARQELLDSADRSKLTGLMEAGDSDIYGRDSGNINATANRASNDYRIAAQRNQNALARQMLAAGMSPSAIAKRGLQTSLGNALNTAGATNQARQAAIADSRSRLTGSAQAGMQMRQSDFSRNRNMGLQDQATQWGKRMDAVGLTKGLTGASSGAYSLANTAGNSAVANQNGTSGQYVNGMSAGNGTIMQGQQIQMQGLNGVLNAQTSAYNNSQSGDTMGGLMGGLAGLGGVAAKAGWISDIRLKENIVPVGESPAGYKLYEFNYIDHPDERFRGVMAQDILAVKPEAVIETADGILAVRYDMLDVNMEKVN